MKCSTTSIKVFHRKGNCKPINRF